MALFWKAMVLLPLRGPMVLGVLDGSNVSQPRPSKWRMQKRKKQQYQTQPMLHGYLGISMFSGGL
jgi:hypothetical protein